MNTKISKALSTLIISLCFTLFYNFSFFKKTLVVYPLNSQNVFFLFTLFAILLLTINLILNLLLVIINGLLGLIRRETIYKGFFPLIILLAMSAAYVMDSYSTVIDETMLLNIIKTSVNESMDLVTFKLFIYAFVLFLLPVFLLYKIKIKESTFRSDIFSNLKSMLVSLVLIFLMLISSGKFYASFFRQQKSLRYYTNPTYWIYSMGKFSSGFFKSSNKALAALGRNAKIHPNDNDRDLVILVIGETARRDRFSLNGATHETNPLLKKENVISFTNVTSCGTSTAISVPCIFSHFGRDNFNVDDANSTENLLDVLAHTKSVNILWRDNNSNSKGVAVRAKYEDYKSPDKNTMCDSECRDEGMLVGLQEHINNVSENDVFIVLHQMGNHGPAYYKRYPKAFEVFKPICQTSELAKCSNEEIVNTYDNAILYTDYFLSKVIGLLKANSVKFNTAMLYVSDHGESLGENGIYLHGMPYIMAPKAQIEVPMIMWFGGNMEKETDYVLLRKNINRPYSHDNIFHTVLGMMEVESSAYNPKLDILHGIHKQN